MAAVGLLGAVIIYPIFHELGHVLAAVILGQEICDFRLFPLPSVVCKTNFTDGFSVAAEGFGGMLLPYLLSLIPVKRNFWLWYLWATVSGICLLSFAISIMGIARYQAGSPMANEDITLVMEHAGEHYALYLAVLIGLAAVRLAQVICSKPMERCLEEFKI